MDDLITLYIEPTTSSRIHRHSQTLSLPEIPSAKISASLNLNNKIYEDSAKYIVLGEPSIYRYLNANRHVRAAYAADAVYATNKPTKESHKDDIKQYCMEFLPNGKDEEGPRFGIPTFTLPAEIIEYVTTNNQWGFNAGLYKDYCPKNGTFEYCVAFEGTNGVTDIGIDALNWFGVQTPQYNNAILIGDTLKKKGIKSVYLSGHSLGGGLAAAASIASQEYSIAYTYNAAWVPGNVFEPSWLDYRLFYMGMLGLLVPLYDPGNTGSITAYVVEGEWLHIYQGHEPNGTFVELKPPKPETSKWQRHNMDPMFYGLFNPNGIY